MKRGMLVTMGWMMMMRVVRVPVGGVW